jgi:PAS domain S-box-containing protein
LSEYSGLRDDEFLPPEIARQFRANDERVLAQGESLQAIEALRQADGIEHYLLVSKFPVPGPDGRSAYVAGIALDITERVRAEEALRLSEARFRVLHDENPAMILTVDEEGTIISTNPACTDHLGYTADELEGQPVLKIFHEGDRPAVAEQLQMCKQNPDQVYRWQFRKIRKDGGVLWVEELARAVYDLNGALNVLVVCQDITEHKHAEEALQKSEKKFAKVFHAAPALLAVSTLKEGRFVDVNDTALRALGYRRDEMIGRTALELNLWVDLFDRTAILQKLDEKGSAKNIEARFRGKSGQTFVGLFSAEYIDLDDERHILSLVEDITLRRRAQEEVERLNTQLTARAAELEAANRLLADDLETMKMLQKLGMLFLHEENLEQVLSQVLDAAISISSADFGNIQIMDPKTSCLHIAVQHGFPQWWLDFWNSVVEGKGVCGTALRRSERVIVEDIEQSPIFVGTDALEIQLKAGVRAVQSTPLVSRSGTLLGMFSTHYKVPHRPADHELRLLDLLARHAADFIEEAQLKEMLEVRAAELEEANRELEAFSYSVAHDLRKPLTIINGYCQVITDLCSDKLGEQCAGYLQDIYDNTVHMNRLIDTLLNFFRVTRMEPRRETADLTAMAQEVADELKHAEPSRRATFRIAQRISAIGDASLLRVVLENLLGNAWKYTGMRDEPVIEFGAAEIDGQQSFFVRDNGPGFANEDADKLFIPFQRLPGAEKQAGFGIGLATVDRIIRRHGGRVWAEGEPGKGATFYFTLGSV